MTKTSLTFGKGIGYLAKKRSRDGNSEPFLFDSVRAELQQYRKLNKSHSRAKVPVVNK
jgi:hypothetical protein